MRKSVCFIIAMALGLCCSSLATMPSKDSIDRARPVVSELLADDIVAVKSGKKSAEKAGDAAMALIANAETDAAKYLLVKEAMALYVVGKCYDKAADAVEVLTRAIPGLTPAEVVDFIKNSARGVRGKEAPRLLAILRAAQSQINAGKDLDATRDALAKKPDDAYLRRKLVELHAASGNWRTVAEVLAPLGAKESQVADAEKGGKNPSVAADYWWDYKPVSTVAVSVFKQHAASLYSKCIAAGELTGLRKTLAEKRIRQAESALDTRTVPQKKTVSASKKDGLYMCIDMSEGPSATKYPVFYFDDVPSSGWTDEYKTTKLVLRKVRRGSFTMGSPKSEPKRESESWMGKETQHKVTLTRDFYLGIFPVTQKQWELVMGSNPSHFKDNPDAPMCPVEKVSYAMIRGVRLGCAVPVDGKVDADSFMYRLRIKTGIASFDLPSECQWEYACRAGTTTCTYAGKYDEKNLDAIAWRKSNSLNRTHAVGNKKANMWGFFDMIGNVTEWQLDRVAANQEPMTVKDYVGNVPNGNAVGRGGCWGSTPFVLRAALRAACYTVNTTDNRYGFRLAVIAP